MPSLVYKGQDKPGGFVGPFSPSLTLVLRLLPSGRDPVSVLRIPVSRMSNPVLNMDEDAVF